jgi:hypothetical protein
MSKITKQRTLSETAAMLAAKGPQPYELWRTLPASDFNETRKLEVACHIGMFMTTIREYRAAIAGDAACAAGIALRMVIPDEIDYPTDARMTLLLHSALIGSAGAALVMAHMLRKMPLDNAAKNRLATSWLVRNLERSARVTHHGGGDRFGRTGIAATFLGRGECRRGHSRLVSNHRGYPDEGTTFDPTFTMEIPDE